MKELMILLAEKMPIEVLLKHLQEALTELKENPDSQKAKDGLAFSCQLYLTRSVAADVGGSEKLIEMANDVEKGHQLLKTTPN